MTDEELANGLRARAAQIEGGSPAPRFADGDKANARIAELENQLGLKKRPFCFNVNRANMRITQLEAALAEKGLTAAAVTTAPPAVVASPAPAPVLQPVQLDVSGLSLDAQVGARKNGLTKLDRTEEIAALKERISVTPDGLTRQCLQARLKKIS